MTRCGFCEKELIYTLVDLGRQPPSNSYLSRANEAEKTYPLRAMVCDRCFLVQLNEVVPADEIFSRDYAYFSSVSQSWVAHAKAYQETVTERFGLDENALVVEIASNDGYLLQHFQRAGIPVLGVEPSPGVARVAVAKNIATIVDFFNAETAAKIAGEGRSADLVVANNVLAHVPDIADFVKGFGLLLKENGVVTVEFPHLLNLLEQTQFDTIYHEHYYYLSLLAVEKIFSANGLRVFDVEEIPTHGGSLRVHGCRVDANHGEAAGVAALRTKERAARLDRIETYAGFDAAVRRVAEGLTGFLADAKRQGKTVAAYGAAAKGNTLINYCGIDGNDIEYAVDLSPAKQDMFLPGSRIPILAPEKLADDRPDYVLILPWNLRDEIVAQSEIVRDWGGQFVVAIPELEIF